MSLSNMDGGEADETRLTSPERPVHDEPTTPLSPGSLEKKRNSLSLQIDTVKVQIKSLRDELKVKETHLAILQKEVRRLDGDETTADKIKISLAKGAQTTKATLSSAATKIALAGHASKEKIVQTLHERRERSKGNGDKEDGQTTPPETEAGTGNEDAEPGSIAANGRSRSFSERMKTAGDSLKASLKRATGKTTPPPTEADEPTPAAQLSMSPLTPAEELKTSKVEEAGVTTE